MKRGIRIVAVVLCLLIALGASAEGKKEKGVIKIGAFLDLSGPTAQWGKDAERGAQIRVREVNEAGGIMGKKIELIVYDVQASPTEAVKAYTRLAKDDNVTAIYGAPISNQGMAVSPVAEQLKVPVVSRALDERVTTPDFDPENPEKPVRVNRYFFMSQLSAFQQAALIAGYAIDKLGMNTFTMLYSPSNSYSLYLARGFEHYVKKRGKKILGGFEFQGGDVDFKSQLTTIKSLNADGLYLPNYIPENANAVKQSRELGMKVTFLGSNTWYKPMDKVAGAAADGAYFPNNISLDDPNLKPFTEKYMAEFNEEPRQNIFFGYDDVGFILEAIKKAQSADPEKVRDAMESITKFEGLIATVNINPKTHRPVGLQMAVLYFEGDQIKTAELRYAPKEP